MKDRITLVAGILLGALFVVFGLNFFLKFIPIPSAPADSHAAAFMGAMYVTGLLTFIKVLEIVGGILVAVPKTRNLGLLVLGPIVVNILAFKTLIARGGLFEPPVVAVAVLSAFLLWSDRSAFTKLIVR